MKVNNMLEAIGNTPHLKINRLFGNRNVWVKLEKFNPTGSIKDRIALGMVEDAEKRGLLKQGGTIIEPTSGNTGIGLALVAAVKGYKIILVMPESLSVERRHIMKAYGADFELTPREKGMNGSIARAKELLESTPNSWMPNQFENPANVEAHARTTAQEILTDFPNGVDYVIAGVGTGGHITAVAQELKKKFPNTKVFAVEPENSAVIGGGQAGPHPLQGLGAGFIPKILNTSILDGTINVGKEESYTYTLRAAKEEGLFCGISSGATLAAVAKKLQELPENASVICFNYDNGERYLSIEDLFA